MITFAIVYVTIGLMVAGWLIYVGVKSKVAIRRLAEELKPYADGEYSKRIEKSLILPKTWPLQIIWLIVFTTIAWPYMITVAIIETVKGKRMMKHWTSGA